MQYHQIGGTFHSLKQANEFAIVYRELAFQNYERSKIDDHIFIKPERFQSFTVWNIYISEALKNRAELYFKGK